MPSLRVLTSLVMLLISASRRQAFVLVSSRDFQRNCRTKALFSSMSHSDEYYTIGLTGSSGCIGTAFRDELKRVGSVNGKVVRLIRLVRSDQAEAKDLSGTDVVVKWNPKGQTAEQIMSPEVAATMDAIVHLSGENVATGLGPLGPLGIRPWTDAKKKEILDSRTVTTKALAKVIAASPTPKSFLVASGIGAYGDHFVGDKYEAVDESADVTSSSGFLAEVSRQWEDASSAAKVDGHRVVNLRFGVVLSKFGGALQKLYPIFWLGGGGNVGSGRQYFSFISARDHVRAIVHALETPTLSGPVNLCSPQPCTNAEFTSALGECLGRPTLLPLPGFMVKTLFGEMGKEMLLGGVRAVPTKLIKSGFEFQHQSIKEALGSALEETI